MHLYCVLTDRCKIIHKCDALPSAFTLVYHLVLYEKMVRKGVCNLSAKKNIQTSKLDKSTKDLGRPKKVFLENKSTIITRSKLNNLETVQKTKEDSSGMRSARNTRSESKENIPLQRPLPYNTRSKSKKNPKNSFFSESGERKQETLLTKAKTQNKCSTVSTIRFVKLNDFNVNSIVLAKQKYSVPWPAQVLSVEKKRVSVHFFGDRRRGFVSKQEIYDFILSTSAIKSIIASKKQHRSYYTGVAEVEHLIGIPSDKSLLI